MNKEQTPQPKHDDDDTLVYRNELLEEIARHLEHAFTAPFGADTIASFAIFIRSMKE